MFIEIFDPDFYFDTEKFMTIPKYRLMVKPKTVVQIDLKAEYYEMLDRPSKRCNDSAEYSFTKCVQVYIVDIKLSVTKESKNIP